MHTQLQQLLELKKDNFGLKLRIYHLEEALRSQWGEKDDGWQLVRARNYIKLDKSEPSFDCNLYITEHRPSSPVGRLEKGHG